MFSGCSKQNMCNVKKRDREKMYENHDGAYFSFHDCKLFR